MAVVVLSACNTGETPKAGGGTAQQAPQTGNRFPLELCREAVNQYVQDSKFVLNNANNGVECVVAEGGGLEIVVLSSDETLSKAPEKLSDYKYKELTLPVRRSFAKIEALGAEPTTVPAPATTREREAAAPRITQVLGGNTASSAAPNPNHGFGTAGVNIVFNGQVVCLSCAHILCASPNPRLGGNVFLGGSNQSNATLWSYEPLDKNGQNHWDVAMAHYDSDNVAAAQMIGGAYPDGLPKCVCTNDKCHLAGAGNGYRENVTVVLGVSGPVQLPWAGNHYAMIEQVVFHDPNSDASDSGAVLCRKDSDTNTNVMIGLEWGRDAAHPTTTYGSPLYRAQWTQVASTKPYPGALPFMTFNATLGGPTNAFPVAPNPVNPQCPPCAP